MTKLPRFEWLFVAAVFAFVGGCDGPENDSDRLERLEQRVARLERTLARIAPEDLDLDNEPASGVEGGAEPPSSSQKKPSESVALNTPPAEADAPAGDRPAPAERTLPGHPEVAVDFGLLARYATIGKGRLENGKFVVELTTTRPVDRDLVESLGRNKFFAYGAGGSREGSVPFEFLPKNRTHSYEKGASVRIRFAVPDDMEKIERLKFQAFPE